MPAPAPATSSRARVVVDFNFRFSTESTDAVAADARARRVLQKHGLDYAIDWTLGGEPFLTHARPPARRVVEAIQATHTGVTAELSTTGGTSDGRFIIDICPQVIEFGPVNASIHKIERAHRARRAREAAAYLPRHAARPLALDAR